MGFHRLALAGLVLCLLCGLSNVGAADEVLLRHDDDMADGKQSYGGSGHVIAFAPPDQDRWYVDRIDVCASQYGGNYDPDQTFCRAYVCAPDMRSLGEGEATYNTWPRTMEQHWGSIDMPFVPVKGPFYVVVAPGSLQYRGLFVAYDTTGKTAQTIHSGSGTVGQAPKPMTEPREWMIRVNLTSDAPEGVGAEVGEGEVLSWDDGSAEDRQSFGGSTGMIVRFDPPQGEALVDAIQLYGGNYGTGQGGDRTGFGLTICDADMNIVGQSMYPYTLFTSDMHWVRVDLIPDVPVPGPFYVIYQGRCAQTDGIYLGIDTTTGSGQSFLGTPTGISDWDFRLGQNAMNWMIRAELKPQ